MSRPPTPRVRALRAASIAAAASLCLGVAVAVPAVAEPLYDEVLDGLVHHYELDETSGTVLVNSGSAGATANATLVNGGRAELGPEGVRFNPDDYADALTGAYVQLPADLTAGMQALTIDYDIWIDPANVGEHQIWSLGSKASCDAATGAAGAALLVEYPAPPGGGRQRERAAEPGSPAARESGSTSRTPRRRTRRARHGPARCSSTACSTPRRPTSPRRRRSTRAGTNCNFLGRSQVPGNYSFRGTLSDFRVYDRGLSAGEVASRAAQGNDEGVLADAAAIDLGLTSAVVEDLELPKLGTVAGSTHHLGVFEPGRRRGHRSARRRHRAEGADSRRHHPARARAQPDATAMLTATVRKGTDSVTVREIPITVPAEFDDAHSVDRDALDLELYATDDIRGRHRPAQRGAMGVGDHLGVQPELHHLDG